MRHFAANVSYLRKKLGQSQEDFADSVGFPGKRSRIAAYETGSSKPGLDDLLKMAEYLKVSLDDLINVDLSNKPPPLSVVGEPITEYTKSLPKGQILPLIPIEAMAGFTPGHQDALSLESELYVVPEFNKKADYLIRVSGTSMSPKYWNGDVLACKKVPVNTFLQWGKVYIMDTVQGALCKRVFPGGKKGRVKLVSDNAEMYPPFEIEYKEVRSLAIVVGVIRLE